MIRHLTIIKQSNAYFAGRLVGNRGSGLVGGTDFAVFKNTFFAGTAEAKKNFSAISQKGVTQCQEFSNWKVVAENTFYLDTYTNEEFEADAASATAFSDGSILKRLVKGSSYPIWTQEVGKDAYPKLKGVYYDIAYDLAGGVNDSAVTELPTGNTEDIVLYAKWSAREIKISYDLVGGTMGDVKNPDKALSGDMITLKSPTREGYLFHGWLGTDGAILNEPGDFDRTYFVNSKNDEIEFKADWTYAPQKPATDADGCYLVTNVHELFYFDEIANSVLCEKPPIKSCIKIMNDIVVNEDMNNANYIDWNPMNYKNIFAGIIYGNGHTISGLYMNCQYFYNDNYRVFYGLIENKSYQQVYPEVQNLYLANFYFANEYYDKVLLNVNGRDGAGDGKSGIRKTIAPAPLKKKIAPKFDAKGRNMKTRPNYGVFF